MEGDGAACCVITGLGIELGWVGNLVLFGSIVWPVASFEALVGTYSRQRVAE